MPLIEEKHAVLSGKADEATKELRAINGRLVKLETWSAMLEETDDRRFKALEQDILDAKG